MTGNIVMMIKHERPPRNVSLPVAIVSRDLCSIYFYKLEDVMGSSVGNRELADHRVTTIKQSTKKPESTDKAHKRIIINNFLLSKLLVLLVASMHMHTT